VNFQIKTKPYERKTNRNETGQDNDLINNKSL